MEDIMIEQSIRAKSVPGESRFAALRRFFIIWFGQLVSLTGSGLTAFALGVWVFQQTGSATSFALIALAGTLPRALFSPVAGALADRYDRRKLMIAADEHDLAHRFIRKRPYRIVAYLPWRFLKRSGQCLPISGLFGIHSHTRTQRATGPCQWACAARQRHWYE
jgi:hypothetical protein